ncbi:MAG: NAD-dependent epimerase/dehydratase family protein [Hyphomonadaceae bacterium]
MTKVLITGAAGFIGAQLTPLFAARGYEVLALTRTPAAQAAQAGVRWVGGDLLDASALARLIAAERPQGLVHAGWRAVHGDVMAAQENWAFVEAGAALFAAFAAAGGARAAVIGSCAEYDWSAGLCQEGVTPMNAQSVYGQAKNALRARLSAMSAAEGFSLVWLRPFFLYGPGEHPSRLVAAVIDALLDGRPAALSHGAQTRDYAFVRDIAAGVLAAYESEAAGPIDLASGQAVSIRRIAEEIGAQIGRPDLLHFGARAAPPDEAPCVLGDPAPALARIGWRAATPLREGLALTIAAARAARGK